MASRKNALMNKQHYKNQNIKTYHKASNATKNVISLFKHAWCFQVCSLENFKNLEHYDDFVSWHACLAACLPAVRPSCTRPRASVLSHNQCIIGGFTNLLFRRRFIHCAMVFPFIPYYLAFFSKKMRTNKKVSIGI